MIKFLGTVALLELACLLNQSAYAAEAADEAPQLVSVEMIWGEAQHSAFTDLIRWRDQWLCAFREGENHVGSQGVIRVLQSDDGQHWKSLSRIEHDAFDLRDANLSITPDGRLMLLAGAKISDAAGRRTGSLVYFSDDGETWTTPEMISELGRWMWGVTWHKGLAWGVVYPAPAQMGVSSLYNSPDGVHFKPVVKNFLTKSEWPTEARLRFGHDDGALCLHRTDAKRNLAYLGEASPPYADWKWRELDRYIGGPNLLQLPSGKWIAAGRILDPKPVTALLSLDLEKGTTTPILKLPSGGDTSYPGLVWHDDMLWMSYYSSHEEKTKIYLAKIRFPLEK
jgi:hypothetical protein